MFSPDGRDLERGWPGRIEGDRVVQLAAQTLQAFFAGGGRAREHAEYRLDDVVLRAPVLHPPSVRLFAAGDFSFANPAAILGPDEDVLLPDGADEIVPVLRQAAVAGPDGAVGGYTQLVEWLAPALEGTKRHDFALSLGPVVLTPDELPDLRLDPLLEAAARNTRLLPGDLLAAPGGEERPLRDGEEFALGSIPFGVLRGRVRADR